MAKSCKCKKPNECEECPEWIFTFADLVMLMMGFFVILWVLKPNPGKQGADNTSQAADKAAEEKWMDTVIDIRKNFGWQPDPSQTDPINRRALQKTKHPDSSGKVTGPGGETSEQKQGAKGTDPLVTAVRPGHTVSYGGKLIFDAGDAHLTPETTQSLDQVIQIIKGWLNIVQVKGHASLDDFPEQAGVSRATRLGQQMDLSIRRAQAVADYLTSHGVNPEVVRIEGCSTFEPVVQRVFGADAQVPNRRVEIEVTDVLVSQRQDASAPTTVPSFPSSQPARGN